MPNVMHDAGHETLGLLPANDEDLHIRIRKWFKAHVQVRHNHEV